jgi:hypothetical protein
MTSEEIDKQQMEDHRQWVRGFFASKQTQEEEEEPDG